MNKYEAMLIIRPDLSEQDRENLFNQVKEVITKNNGTGVSGSVWSEKRKLYFTLRKYKEGLYYLVAFSAPASSITEIRHAYNLNENILRELIIRTER